MNITSARATVGLNCKATPTSTEVAGALQIGANTANVSIKDPTSAYCVRAFMTDGANVILDLMTGIVSSFTAFTAGVAQVETATAVGTVTVAGNAAIVVTAAGLTGSPLAIPVAVAVSDTTTLWAAKVRTALNSNAAVSAMFTASGTGAAITLTRRPIQSIVAGNDVVDHYADNDVTTNLALGTGTAVGITTDPTSANTTVGAQTGGTKIYDDATDFEGVPIVSSTPVCVEYSGTGLGNLIVDGNVLDYFQLRPGGKVLLTGSGADSLSAMDTTVTCTATGGSVDLIITVIGKAP